MSNVENVCPQVLRGVSRELRRLAARPPAGVKLVLRDDDLTDVVAHIEGPADTPYFGGVFRVRLVLGREFPAAPPRAFFLTRIFHPNVSPATGEVCVNTLKRDWRPELGLEHALLAVKCLLIAPNAESALNAEAAALLRDKYDDYFARAKLLADIHARPDAHHKHECAEASDSAALDGTGRAGDESGSSGASAERGASAPSAVSAASAESSSEGGPSAKRERRAPAKDRRRILKRL